MLPFEIVRTDISGMRIVGYVIAITPPGTRRGEFVRICRRRTQLELRGAGLSCRRSERLSAVWILDAVQVAAEAELPVLADAALQPEGGLREGGTGGGGRAGGHAGHRHHVAAETRHFVGGGCGRTDRIGRR